MTEKANARRTKTLTHNKILISNLDFVHGYTVQYSSKDKSCEPGLNSHVHHLSTTLNIMSVYHITTGTKYHVSRQISIVQL